MLGLHCCSLPSFSLVVMSRDDFELQCSASHCGGFSCCKARAPGAQGSVTAVSGLESTGLVVEVHGLSCSEACGTFLDQGSSLSFLHLVGGFSTTEPPGKPQNEGLEITHLETLHSGTGSFCGAHGGIGDDETK